MSKKAMTLALEALRNHSGNYKLSKAECVKYNAVEKALEEALAKQEQGEPDKYVMDIECTKCGAKQSGILTVNTTPQPAQKPLSEAAIEGLAKFVAVDDFNYDFARAIEKAHGIKENT